MRNQIFSNLQWNFTPWSLKSHQICSAIFKSCSGAFFLIFSIKTGSWEPTRYSLSSLEKAENEMIKINNMTTSPKRFEVESAAFPFF